MSDPEDESKNYAELSDLYEKSLDLKRTLHRVGNGALVTLSSIGTMNFIIADQPPLGRYVAGAVTVGAFIKAATIGIAASIDDEVSTPILDIQRQRFEDEIDLDEY